MRARKGLVLPRASHSGEIAMAGSRRLRSMLVAAPVLFAHAVVHSSNKVVSAPLAHPRRAVDLLFRSYRNACRFISQLLPSLWWHALSFLGFVEESTKLALARWRCCGPPCDLCHPPPDAVSSAPPAQLVTAAQTNLVLVLAASLGFSTVESIMYSSSKRFARVLNCNRFLGVALFF